MTRSLVVMSKRPAAGGIKTRLVPPLTGEQAANFYEYFLRMAYRSPGRSRTSFVTSPIHPQTGRTIFCGWRPISGRCRRSARGWAIGWPT